LWIINPRCTTTFEKKYSRPEIDGHRCFAKQSLSLEEASLKHRRPEATSYSARERLRNEAGALAFISQNTEIPVPDIVRYYDDREIVAIALAPVPGVQMRMIQDRESRVEVCRQIDDFVAQMREITNPEATGFAGHLCAHPMVSGRAYPEPIAPIPPTPGVIYPMCHGDLNASNVIVNPDSARVTGIIDWEYAGFYPEIMDFPYYKTAISSPLKFNTAMYPRGYLDASRNELKRLARMSSNPQSTGLAA